TDRRRWRPKSVLFYQAMTHLWTTIPTVEHSGLRQGRLWSLSGRAVNLSQRARPHRVRPLNQSLICASLLSGHARLTVIVTRYGRSMKYARSRPIAAALLIAALAVGCSTAPTPTHTLPEAVEPP